MTFAEALQAYTNAVIARNSEDSINAAQAELVAAVTAMIALVGVPAAPPAAAPQ